MESSIPPTAVAPEGVGQGSGAPAPTGRLPPAVEPSVPREEAQQHKQRTPCPRVVRKRRTLVATLCDGETKRLTDFSAYSSIEKTAASPDGAWLFVHWRGEKPPLKLDVYDLRTSLRTARFAPGFGGDFAWTPGDHIFHRWGCGTECQVWRVYDTRGKVLHEDGTTGAWPSPDYRYVAFAPEAPPSGWSPWDVREHPVYFVVRDLDHDREARVTVSRPSRATVAMKLWNYAWLPGRRIQVDYRAFTADADAGSLADATETEGRATVSLPTTLRP